MAGGKIVLGDTSSHGGNVATSAARTYVNGILVARKGDTFNCPIDGPNPIATGSSTVIVEGHPVARNGDTCSCGAVLITSNPEVTAGG